MKKRYMIDNDTNHYVEFHVDLETKKMSASYQKDNMTIINHEVDATAVFQANLSANPYVQIAKKGRVWDFHLFNFDAFGKEVRRSVGLLLSENVRPTDIEFKNEGEKDYTLIDYITHPLDVYNSALKLAHFHFDDIEGLSGTSGSHTTSPVITGNGQLTLGNQAEIELNIAGEGEIDLSEVPMIISMKIEEFSNNDVSNQSQVSLQIGDNLFHFSTTDGLTYASLNDSTVLDILPADEMTDGFVFHLELKRTVAHLIVDQKRFLIDNFHWSKINEVILYGNGNHGELTLIDHVLIQGLENFRTDSIPPAPVEQLEVIGGYREAFLAWKENTESDLAGYRVYVDGALQSPYLIPSADYQVTGLEDGVTYEISVVAVDRSGNESIPVRASIRSSSNPMYEIRNLAFKLQWNGLYMEWENPTHLSFHSIEIHRTNIETGEIVHLVDLQKDQLSYLDTEKLPAGFYKYRIRTVDIYGSKTSGVELIKWIAPLYMDETKITDLQIRDGILTWNPLHLRNDEVHTYNLYIDDEYIGSIDPESAMDGATGLCTYNLDTLVDWNNKVVIKVLPIRVDTVVLEGQEIVYYPSEEATDITHHGVTFDVSITEETDTVILLANQTTWTYARDPYDETGKSWFGNYENSSTGEQYSLPVITQTKDDLLTISIDGLYTNTDYHFVIERRSEGALQLATEVQFRTLAAHHQEPPEDEPVEEEDDDIENQDPMYVNALPVQQLRIEEDDVTQGYALYWENPYDEEVTISSYQFIVYRRELDEDFLKVKSLSQGEVKYPILPKDNTEYLIKTVTLLGEADSVIVKFES